jgi:hypothetical protein
MREGRRIFSKREAKFAFLLWKWWWVQRKVWVRSDWNSFLFFFFSLSGEKEKKKKEPLNWMILFFKIFTKEN